MSPSPRVVVIDECEGYRIVISAQLKMLFAVDIVDMGANGLEALEQTAQKCA